MSRPGHLVSAEELLEHVWDENADPFTQTVRVTVGTLRRKLSSTVSRADRDRHRARLSPARGGRVMTASRAAVRLVIDKLPPWARTVRMRLALTYSALLFGDRRPAARRRLPRAVDHDRRPAARPGDGEEVREDRERHDRLPARRAVPGRRHRRRPGGRQLSRAGDPADYSVIALAVMFVLSLFIGWWVAGRALRPVGAITATAREITATDLSRRIPDGTADELRTLTETINGMLGPPRARPSGPSGPRRGRVPRAAQPGRRHPGQRRGRSSRDDVSPQERAGRRSPSSAGRPAG